MLPAFTLGLLTVLVIAKSADALTVSVAVITLGFAPTAVVNEPAGMVLAASGETSDVTTAEIEQLAPGATTVPTGDNICVPPAVATAAPPEQVVATVGVAALNKPVGYASIKAVLKVAETSLCVLVKVMTSKDVPPAVIVEGLKVLDTKGALAVIVSISATVQVPVAQPAPVLETPTGTEIEAVLVTWVCADANWGTHTASKNPSTK